MESKTVPKELLALREQIDAIDEQLLELLSGRFDVTQKIGEIKARNGLDSVDTQRERQKLERLRRLAEDRSLNSEFVGNLFQDIFNEVVANHKRARTPE